MEIKIFFYIYVAIKKNWILKSVVIVLIFFVCFNFFFVY